MQWAPRALHSPPLATHAHTHTLPLSPRAGVRHEDGPADPSQLPELRQRIAQQVAAVLHAMPLQDLRGLAEERGVAGCAGCAQRRGLLEALLPAVRVSAAGGVV